MKKIGALVWIFAFCMGILAGCGDESFAVSQSEEEKIHIVCTIFPEYDWLKQVIGDREAYFDVELLLDNGTDLHNYQPTAEDIATIANCDLFIYGGGESAAWVEDALSNVAGEDVEVLKLFELLEGHLQEEEHVEGMADGHAHHGDACEVEDHHHEDEAAYDEHVWLSLKNAQVIVAEIAEAVSKMDPEGLSLYFSNCDSYLRELSDLDEQFAQTIEAAKKGTILVADRFPFLYLVKDYDLNYYAAFSGCSAETEASFETITFLMEKVDDLDLSAILVIENSDHKLAETVAANTAEKNQEILVLNSLQSITERDIESGVTYLSIMEENLEVLRKALN